VSGEQVRSDPCERREGKLGPGERRLVRVLVRGEEVSIGTGEWRPG
jgi:hypothetical protein